MRRMFCILSLFFTFCALCFAAGLPGFEDFRRVDRVRRLTGQLQTADLMKVMHIDQSLIKKTAAAHPDDTKLQWAAAELSTEWPDKQNFFERALQSGGTNETVALRYAGAAALTGELDLAQHWVKHCESNDNRNTVPWLVELWVLRQQKQAFPTNRVASFYASRFRDYSVDATRARIALLEAAGYSAYSARRLGFSPGSFAIYMARDLGKPPLDEGAQPILKEIARSMQDGAPFFLTEMAGQSLESAVLAMRLDAVSSPEVRFRMVEMEKRREQMKDLLARVDRNAVDLATESEMIQYFDKVLADGEEAAMRWLYQAVRRQPTAP